MPVHVRIRQLDAAEQDSGFAHFNFEEVESDE